MCDKIFFITFVLWKPGGVEPREYSHRVYRVCFVRLLGASADSSKSLRVTETQDLTLSL